MMYLSRLTLNYSYAAMGWLSNPYRVHQRLLMACGDDLRVLFRIEREDDRALQVLVQSRQMPNWAAAFDPFRVLARPAETKTFDLHLTAGQRLQFRLVANPTVKRDGRRLGLLVEVDQQNWLQRKLLESGAHLIACRCTSLGFQHSHASDAEVEQVHLQVMFDGLMEVDDPERLVQAVAAGIGPAKGFGCGLLSLAPAP